MNKFGVVNVDAALKGLEDKKAMDVRVFDVSDVSPFWDYFIIATGTSKTHISALFKSAEDEVQKAGGIIVHKEKGGDSNWMLLDTADVLVHIFDNETRLYYSLEKLWGEKEIFGKKSKKEIK